MSEKLKILELETKLLKGQSMLAEFKASNYDRAKHGYSMAYDNSDYIQDICDDILNEIRELNNEK